jgi:hypothetical protein
MPPYFPRQKTDQALNRIFMVIDRALFVNVFLVDSVAKYFKPLPLSIYYSVGCTRQKFSPKRRPIFCPKVILNTK